MTRTDDRPDFATWFPTALAGSRPFYGGARQPAVRSGRRSRIGRVVDAALVWQQRARERRQLMQLSDHMLRDIGISRATAAGEAEKPFWRV
jgi:uncharacterized protein YjiS (DUF1127 family)